MLRMKDLDPHTRAKIMLPHGQRSTPGECTGIGPINLPYPPSVNHYYGRDRRGNLYLKPEGIAYRASVAACLSGCGQIAAKDIALHAEIFPPDHRRRDLDNTQKALLDALQHGGAIDDDYRICWLLIEREAVTKGGKVVVTIRSRPTKFRLEEIK